MNQKQIMAIAVVGVLIIAGIAAVVMMNGGSDDKKDPKPDQG